MLLYDPTKSVFDGLRLGGGRLGDQTMIDRPRWVPASGTVAQSLVILLHGYGSNGDDLISLAPHWAGALPATVFVAPNAPDPCPGAPGGYQWWTLPVGLMALESASPLLSRTSSVRASALRAAAAFLPQRSLIVGCRGGVRFLAVRQ